MRKLIFFISVVICLSFTIKGKVVRVSDGDTIIVLANGEKIRVRLYGIDAPEKGQHYANVSRKHLYELCHGKEVEIENKGTDEYERVLGVVHVNGVNVNENMLKYGLAWRYKHNKDKEYLKLQNEAKKRKLNIWSMKNPVDPYEYRKKQNKDK